ncbi:hypothetical protein ACLIA0_07900 [Bacillaceae bacterium W0354]
MKFLSRLFIAAGLIGVTYAFLKLFIDYTSEDWSSFKEFSTYFLMESVERIVLLISIILVLFGRFLLKKVRKRGRIFY